VRWETGKRRRKRLTGGLKFQTAVFLWSGIYVRSDGRLGGCGLEATKKRLRPAPSSRLRNFPGDGRHELVEAHQVQDPFEVVGQRHQAPFGPDLDQALEQKVGVPEEAFDRPEGMFAQLFSQLHNFGMCLNSRRHRLQDRFILFTRNGPVALVPGALGFERAARAAAGPVVAHLPVFFIGAEAISQLLARRTDIDILLRIVSETALAKQTLGGVGAGVGLGHVGSNLVLLALHDLGGGAVTGVSHHLELIGLQVGFGFLGHP